MPRRSWVPLVFLLIGAARLSATPLHPALDLEGPGLSIVYGGVGLDRLGSSSRNLTIQMNGSVERAFLYWTGRDRPCVLNATTGECWIPAQPYKDQVLRLDGERIEGTVTGTETQPVTSTSAILNIGYRADVTDLVRVKGNGRLTFTLSDGDPTSNLAFLDGAGLLVIYTDPSRPAARVLVYDGLDFAYGEDWTPGRTLVTEPFTFLHGAARGARDGEVVVFVGDAERLRPDRIDITRQPSVINGLDGSSGAMWDVDRIPVKVPGGALSTSVQLFSEPVGGNPDSLLWVAAAMRVPLPVATGCSAEFWNAHPEAWKVTGIATTQQVKFVFSGAADYGEVGEASLRTALRFRPGDGLLGVAKELVRAAAAALLNSVHASLEYPRTRTRVIIDVNDALLSRDAVRMLNLTAELEKANAAECPLD